VDAELGQRIDMSGKFPPWKFNQVWGYFAEFRSGHWIKCALYDPQPRPGASQARPKAIHFRAVSEGLIRRDTQKGLKEAILQAIEHAKRTVPKQYVDLNLHLIDSLNLKTFLAAPTE